MRVRALASFGCRPCLRARPTGSAVFICDDVAALERLGLVAEPRAAIHSALAHPSRYMGMHVVDE